MQYEESDHTKSFNADPAQMTSMGYGKRYQLKTSKNDETTPGPIYDDKTKTISESLSCVADKRCSTFGLKEQKVFAKGQQRALLGKDTPGPAKYSLEQVNETFLSTK